MPIPRPELPHVIRDDADLAELTVFFENAAVSPESYGLDAVHSMLQKIEVVFLRWKHVFDDPANEEARGYRDRLQSARERLEEWLHAALKAHGR